MAPNLACKKTSSDNMPYKNRIQIFSWLCSFTWRLTYQSWSAGAEDNCYLSHYHIV